MDEPFELYTTNSDLNENSTDTEVSVSNYPIILDFPVKLTFHPPLKFSHMRDRIWTRVYPDGTISIHEYKLQEQIGKGSYAVVYSANNTVIGKMFALRMVDRPRLTKTFGTQEAADRFIWSAALLMEKIYHPNVVRLYEVFFNPLVVPSPYIKPSDTKTGDAPQVLEAGTIYSDLGANFCSTNAVTLSSVSLRLSACITEQTKDVTQTMVKNMITPMHHYQLYSPEKRTLLRYPENVDSYNNMFIYVLEWCNMKDFGSIIRQLTLKDITVLFYQTACALEHMHSLLIVHHDIKLANIMINCQMDHTSSELNFYYKPTNPYACGIDLFDIQLRHFLSIFSAATDTSTKRQTTLKAWFSYRNVENTQILHSGLDVSALTVDDINNPQRVAFFAMCKAGLVQDYTTEFLSAGPGKVPTLLQEYPLPYIPLGAWDSNTNICSPFLTSEDLPRVLSSYLYYSTIFSQNFDSTQKSAFEKLFKRMNINNYPLIAKLSDFDTARDLSIHGKTLPSLQDLLTRIAYELIHVLIDVFSNENTFFSSIPESLDAFLDEFFFSTISCECDHYKSNVLRTKYYANRKESDQAAFSSKNSNTTGELKSFINSNSKPSHPQETLSLSISASPSLPLFKSSGCFEPVDRVSATAPSNSDTLYNVPLNHNELKVCPSPMSSTVVSRSIAMDGHHTQIFTISDPTSMCTAPQPSSHSISTNMAPPADSFLSKEDSSTFKSSLPHEVTEEFTSSSSQSFQKSPNNVGSRLQRQGSKIPKLKRQLTGFKSYTRQLPHVYKTIYFSKSQKFSSRRSPSSTRLYLQYFLKYLSQLAQSKVNNRRTLQEFYSLLELIDKYFSSNIFEQKLSERLVTLFSTSEFVCHHPLSIHSFPAYVSSVAGTRSYMSPESLRVWNIPSTMTLNLYMGMPSDVWQFGITLYFALIGKHRELPLQRSSHEAMQISATLSLLVSDLLCGMLTSSPMLRYTMIEVLNHPFFDASNFPLTVAPDQFFTVSFSSYCNVPDCPSKSVSKDVLPNADPVCRGSDTLNSMSLRSLSFSSAVHLNSTLFDMQTANSKSIGISTLTFDKLHCDAYSIRKEVDSVLRFLLQYSNHGQELLQMSLRLRKYHFWVMTRRRDILVRKNRHLFRRSSLSNDELYSLLHKGPCRKCMATRYINVADANEKPSLWMYRMNFLQNELSDDSADNYCPSTNVHASNFGTLSTPNSIMYSIIGSSAPSLSGHTPPTKRYFADRGLRNEWPIDRTFCGKFDLMTVAAGDSVFDQLQNELYLMLNIVPWKSSFVRMKPYIPQHLHDHVNLDQVKTSFYQIFNTHRSNLTDLSPFSDVEINIKEISTSTDLAFPKLLKFFTMGLLDDVTVAQNSTATTVSTRNLEYLFTNSLLKSMGNIWGLIKALKSIQVGFLLESLVSTVPYFEKLTVSRLSWIMHLYTIIKNSEGVRPPYLCPTASTSSVAPHGLTTIIHSSPHDNTGASHNSLGRQMVRKNSSPKVISSGMNKVFTNQHPCNDLVFSPSVCSVMTYSYSTDAMSPIRSSGYQQGFDLNCEEFEFSIGSNEILLSGSSLFENNPETMRWNYSFISESTPLTQITSVASEGLTTIFEEDRIISSVDVLSNNIVTPIGESAFIHTLPAEKDNVCSRPTHSPYSIGGTFKTGMYSGRILSFDKSFRPLRDHILEGLEGNQFHSCMHKSSSVMLSKGVFPAKHDIRTGLKEHFQEDFGESLSRHSVSECGTDMATIQDGKCIPDIFRSRGMLPLLANQSSGSVLLNNRVMLFHIETNKTKEIATLYSEIQNALQSSSTSKSNICAPRSFDQLVVRPNVPCQSPRKAGVYSLYVDTSQEKSDSTRFSSTNQNNRKILCQSGSATALAGIFSEMSMQCKMMEKMSRFVSMQASSSYSSSSGDGEFFSSVIPRRETVIESYREHGSSECVLPRSASLSSTDKLTAILRNVESNPTALSMKENANQQLVEKRQKTIRNLPMVPIGSFVMKNDSVKEETISETIDTTEAQSSDSVFASKDLELPPNKDKNILLCALDILDSAPPKEEPMNNTLVLAKVTQFLGLDLENLDDLEIEYSTSTNK